MYFVTAPVMINIESVFLFMIYMNAFDQTAMHAVIYIVLSIFMDLKLERIIGLGLLYLRI